jgi:diguanylate cyclase (GGDEF)-like protein
MIVSVNGTKMKTAKLNNINQFMKKKIEHTIIDLYLSLRNHSKLFWATIGLVSIIGVGYFDFLSGFEIAISLFYLIPISLVVWFGGKTLGIFASAVSAITWLIADIAAGQSYSHVGVYVWNMLIPFGFFLVVSLLLSALKKALQHESELAHTDYLTGAANARFFFNMLQGEIERSRRYSHPFAVVYVDLDNFKKINDQFGHSIGDDVLRIIVNIVRRNIRKTDVVARIGGDEFGILLLETEQEETLAVISKIQDLILEEMRSHAWPVTLSIGVLFCIDSPSTSDAVIKIADGLMYSTKMNGKNGIKYSTYGLDNILLSSNG